MRVLSICLALLLTLASSKAEAQSICFKEKRASLIASYNFEASKKKHERLIAKKVRHDSRLLQRLALLNKRISALQLQQAVEGLNPSKISSLGLKINSIINKQTLLTKQTGVIEKQIAAAAEKIPEAEKLAQEKAKILADCLGEGKTTEAKE